MVIFQKPNKRFITAALAAMAMLMFRRKRFLNSLAQLAFIASLRQWSKAEYISGANKFRKALGVAGIFVAQTFASYRKRFKR